MAARLRALGVPFVGFERLDDVGGTWHPSRLYPGLKLHTPAYGAEFEGFPYRTSGQSHDAQDERPSGQSIHSYIRHFADHHDLLRSFSFSSTVRGIAYSTRDHTATVTVERSDTPRQEGSAQPAGGVGEEGPFDLVVFASTAARPIMPSIPGASAFRGHSCHASAVGPSLLARIASERRHVVVVGAGRSACDIVLALLDAGVAPGQLTWLVRRPYLFFKLERCWHRCCNAARHSALRRAASRLRSVGALAAVWLSIMLPRLGWRLMWALDYVYSPQLSASEADDEARKWAPPPFQMGMLDAEQRRTLSSAVQQRRGEVHSLDAGGLLLCDGERIDTEVIIWATGYESGACELLLQRDGGTPSTLPSDTPLFEHMLPVSFPALAVLSHFVTAPGPAAAREAAEYIVYHLCVRPPLSEVTLVREASVQACRPPVSRALLFAPGFWHNLLLVQFDLINAGIVPVHVGYWRLINLWVLNRVPQLNFGLLPPWPPLEMRPSGSGLGEGADETGALLAEP